MSGPGAQLERTLDRLDSIEQELAELQDVVRHTDALATVGAMTASLAHELNNLLTPAMSYAQLAERSPDNRELVAKALRRTIESIQGATRLLDATLDLATPNTSTLSPDDCCIDNALTAAIACLTREPTRDGILIERHIDTQLRARISMQELQQVFVNLLTNSVRVLRRKGGGRIEVLARPKGTSVEIDFRDSGPGISNIMRTTLFQPFVTSESPTSGDPQQGGRGLGLAICHRTITARKGTIAVDEAPGGGARFLIELPPSDPDHNAARSAA